MNLNETDNKIIKFILMFILLLHLVSCTASTGQKPLEESFDITQYKENNYIYF